MGKKRTRTVQEQELGVEKRDEPNGQQQRRTPTSPVGSVSRKLEPSASAVAKNLPEFIRAYSVYSSLFRCPSTPLYWLVALVLQKRPLGN